MHYFLVLSTNTKKQWPNHYQWALLPPRFSPLRATRDPWESLDDWVIKHPRWAWNILSYKITTKCQRPTRVTSKGISQLTWFPRAKDAIIWVTVNNCSGLKHTWNIFKSREYDVLKEKKTTLAGQFGRMPENHLGNWGRGQSQEFLLPSSTNQTSGWPNE